MRVVSLLPSATETVCALGHEAELVGRSAECDYPASIRGLPVLMRPKTWDADRPSREIDARVRRTLHAKESLYELDLDRLRALDPDVLFTQDLCSVCSVTDAEVAAACAKADVAPRIVSLTPRTLSDVWLSVDTVGRALNDAERGRDLVRALRVRSRVRPSEAGAPKVAVVEWLDPPIVAGLWAPDMIRSAGGQPLGVRRGRPGVRTTWDAIATLEPELTVISPCSFSVERTRRELKDPALGRAVGRVRSPRGVYLADEAYFSRPGPRLADGIDLLRSLLRGDAGSPPMPVEAWETPAAEVSA
jgi:iron complex transport system substrate-binding protein